MVTILSRETCIVFAIVLWTNRGGAAEDKLSLHFANTLFNVERIVKTRLVPMIFTNNVQISIFRVFKRHHNSHNIYKSFLVSTLLKSCDL